MQNEGLEREINMDTYEFKLAEAGRSWQEVVVFTTVHNLTGHNAAIFGKHLARQFKCEVRFNVLGSLQGHYVQPQALVTVGG